MKPLAILLAALLLTACGGGQASDPEQRKNEPTPQCVANPGSCK